MGRLPECSLSKIPADFYFFGAAGEKGRAGEKATGNSNIKKMKTKIKLTEEQEKEFEEMREEFRENGFIYAPHSIYHGMKLHDSNGRLPLSDVVLARIEIEKLNDFLEYLFEHSEHCEHIEQSEAWNEFEKYEYAQQFAAEEKK